MAWRGIELKKLLVVSALVTGLAFGQEDAASKDDKKREPEKRAAVMGTAAAAGAAIGAAIAKDNRAKGAIVGAAVGGLAGLIIDQIMKKKDQEAARVPGAEAQKLLEPTETR